MTATSPPDTARRLLITGASSGIGLGIARAFAASGAQVPATGATDDEVQAAAERDSTIRFKRLDVRDQAAVDTLVTGLGPLDVVVNSAPA